MFLGHIDIDTPRTPATELGLNFDAKNMETHLQWYQTQRKRELVGNRRVPEVSQRASKMYQQIGTSKRHSHRTGKRSFLAPHYWYGVTFWCPLDFEGVPNRAFSKKINIISWKSISRKACWKNLVLGWLCKPQHILVAIYENLLRHEIWLKMQR